MKTLNKIIIVLSILTFIGCNETDCSKVETKLSTCESNKELLEVSWEILNDEYDSLFYAAEYIIDSL